MQKIKLNLIPQGVPPVVYASLYDAHREFKLEIFDGISDYTIPDDAIVTLFGTKPDNKSFSYNSEDQSDIISFSESVVTISSSQQMTAVPGFTNCEIRISNNGTVIGTLNFKLYVEKSTFPIDPWESDSDLQAYQTAINATEHYATTAYNSAQDAANSASEADKTYQNIVSTYNSAVTEIRQLTSDGKTALNKIVSDGKTDIQTLIDNEMPQGSGGNYAWIRVRTTDPILFNQNVTASINSKTLGADTISAYSGVGVACVAVPKNGTYTVTAKNAYDGKTVTQTATVSEKGQVVECSMQSTYSTLTVNVYDTKEDKNRIGGTYKLYKGDVIYAEGTLSTSGPTTVVSQASGTCKISILVNSKERTKDVSMAIGGTSNADFYTSFDTTVTFSGCTDEEFVNTIAALDDGTISASELAWAVGDTRTVNLSAMSATGVGELHNAETVTFVIQNVGGVTLSNGKECHYVVGLLNSLATTGYMNSSNANSGSWKSSARRTWCNSVFRNAIPSTIRDCFKQFKCVTATEYSASTTTTTDDYFALPAAKEVFGGTATSAGSETSYSNLTEFNALTQFEWYKTSANRIKKIGNSGSASWWWERSPFYSGSSSFCCVITGGTASNTGASGTNGLAPFGCI